MSDARGVRLARVRGVVAAGRRAADPADPIGRAARVALLGSSGLSPAGVELALSAHLETDPAPEHLDALLDAAGAAPRCHVVLSANVCTAALRAVAVAVAVAPSVFLRPSRRDPALARLLAQALAEDRAFAETGASVACVDSVTPAPGDQLHVYGSDATVREIRAGAPPGTIVLGHGSGIGVAVIAADDPIEAAALALARDVVPFDQRGCLSPRVALVEGDGGRARAFAGALHEALGALSVEVPRGPLDAAGQAEVALYRASMQAAGEVWEGEGHLVGLDPAPRALLLPPPARVVHVVSGAADAARALLAPWAGLLTSIGVNGECALGAAVRALAPRARRAHLGEMQRPPLDGPVDLRPR